MLKITRRTEHRKITLDEFVRQKSSQPYKTWRQTGKTCNFLLIFGGSAMIFAEQSLELSWTLEQCWDYIKENDCYPELEEVKRVYRNISDDEAPFVACATRIRNNFFKGYPGLMRRIRINQAFAAKHGYVRSVFGHSRKEIELFLAGDWDRKNLSRMLRNLNNISANTDIQNMEGATTKRVMYEMQNWLEENGYKSRLWNEVHDSLDLYAYKPELKEVLTHLKHLCERQLPEMKGSSVPLVVDCEISDLNKGQYYKGGSSPESYGIKWDEL